MTDEPVAGVDPYSPPLADLMGAGRQGGAEPPSEGVPFLPRAGARLIDLGVHYVTSILVGLGVGLAAGIFAAMNGVPLEPLLARFSEVGPLVFIASLLGAVASETVSEGFAGVTVGKLVVGLSVVREDGSPIDFGAAARRSLAYLWDALVFGAVAYHSMSQSPLQQRYGDRWAKTVVVRRATRPARLRPSAPRLVAAVLGGLAADAVALCVGWALNIL